MIELLLTFDVYPATMSHTNQRMPDNAIHWSLDGDCFTAAKDNL